MISRSLPFLLVLALAAGSACAIRPPETTPPAPPPADRIEPGPALPRFEITVSYTANLVHWIDNLAGSSIGKTVPDYQRFWWKAHGRYTNRDREMLAAWREIRYKQVRLPKPRAAVQQGCLPISEPIPSWRHRFRVRSYEAESPEEFVDSLSDWLAGEERDDLREVIDHFRGRFDASWQKMAYLTRFARRFGNFLEESDLLPFLAEMAAFFGIDPDEHEPGRIHLIALPGYGGTHAQANGRHLLMEIRPSDTPREQIQVIAHETAHYFWHLIPPGRMDAMAARIHEASTEGPILWRLLLEGIPTALGQGLAEARLAPDRFSFRHTWYHLDRYDRFAKRIYPTIRNAFEEGRTIQEGVLEEIAEESRWLTSLRLARPTDYLMDTFFAIGDGMFIPFHEIRTRAPILSEWPFGLANPEAGEFLRRYSCLSGVVLLGPADSEDPDSLPWDLRPPDPYPAGANGRTGAPPGTPAASIQSRRRPGGGILFYLTAPTRPEVRRVAEAFLALGRVPEKPILLESPPAP